MQSTCDVSVVIPAYNAEDTIVRALSSVFSQSCRPLEIILINDGSSDNTAGAVKGFISEQKEIPLKLISLENNRGPANARNIGWNASKAGYLAFLDADDAWHPDKLRIQYEWMSSHPDAGLSGHPCPVISSDNFPMISGITPKVRQLGKAEFLLSNKLSTPTVMLRRELPYRFEENKRYAEDFQLWLRILLDNIPVYYIDFPLACIYKAYYGAGGLSAQLWAMEKGELEMYWRLSREKRLNVVLAFALSGFSLAKYLRRMALLGITRNKKQIPGD